MIDIVEDNILLEGIELSEDIQLLSEENTSKAFEILAFKVKDAKEEVKTEKVSKGKSSSKSRNKQVGMAAIVVASIGAIVAYTLSCKSKCISVTAPVKSALNRVKNIFKSAKSKNPDSAGQYDDMIDRVDSALDKIED